MANCPNCGKPASQVDDAEGGVLSCGEAGCGLAFVEGEDYIGGGAATGGHGEPVVRPDTGEDGTEPAEPPTGSEPPAKSASRAAWDEYAESLGLDSGDYASREEVIAAVEERTQT